MTEEQVKIGLSLSQHDESLDDHAVEFDESLALN
jgi:hypothetical protein